MFDHESDLYLELVLGPSIVAVEKRDKPAGGGRDTRIPRPCGTAIGLPDHAHVGNLALQCLDDGRGVIDRLGCNDCAATERMLRSMTPAELKAAVMTETLTMCKCCSLPRDGHDLIPVRK
jgi:hypothetical protein